MSAAILGTAFYVGLPADEPPDVRRLPKLDRMVLAVAREALRGNAGPVSALVFGTGWGGLTATVDFLEGMAVRGPAFASPAAFHESVHHAPAGQLSIRLGITGPCLTITSREISGETALKTGLDLARRGFERVLVVAADEVVPALVNAYAAFGATAPTESAVAILLGHGDGVQVEAVRLSAEPTRTLRYANTAMPGPGLAGVVEAARRLAPGASTVVRGCALGGASAEVELRRAPA